MELFLLCFIASWSCVLVHVIMVVCSMCVFVSTICVCVGELFVNVFSICVGEVIVFSSYCVVFGLCFFG